MRPLCVLAMLLTCGCTAFPRDSAAALDRIRGGELRVGVADNPPWVRVEGGEAQGIEPDLIREWARQLGARVTFHRAAEADLAEALHRRELDVVAAGLTSRTPYTSRIATTQPYVEAVDRTGARQAHVLAVTPGENALLLSLDRFLAAQDRGRLQQRARGAAETAP